MTWPEVWHEGLEEASRMYFGDGNVDGMLRRLQVREAQGRRQRERERKRQRDRQTDRERYSKRDRQRDTEIKR